MVALRELFTGEMTQLRSAELGEFPSEKDKKDRSRQQTQNLQRACGLRE